MVIKPPVIVVGSYRGGTSMVAGVLKLSGAWVGPSMPGRKYNPKGYFENESLKNVLHLMLQISGYNDFDNLPPENLITDRNTDRLQKILLSLLLSDGFREGTPLLKNPKIALFWPYFDQAFPNARWVIARRNELDTVASIKRVNPFTLQPDTPVGSKDILSVVRQYHKRLDSIVRHVPGNRVREVVTEDVAAGDVSKIQSVVEWLDLAFDEKRIRGFIDPSSFQTAAT